MKIEEQVLSIEQMQHLNEVGLKVENTALCWADLSEPGKFSVSPNYENAHEILREGCVIIPTLTLQEILELLPKSIICKEVWHGLYIDYECMNISYSYMDLGGMSAEETFPIKNDKSASLMETAYSTLCWVLENGYLES